VKSDALKSCEGGKVATRTVFRISSVIRACCPSHEPEDPLASQEATRACGPSALGGKVGCQDLVCMLRHTLSRERRCAVFERSALRAPTYATGFRDGSIGKNVHRALPCFRVSRRITQGRWGQQRTSAPKK